MKKVFLLCSLLFILAQNASAKIFRVNSKPVTNKDLPAADRMEIFFQFHLRNIRSVMPVLQRRHVVVETRCIAVSTTPVKIILLYDRNCAHKTIALKSVNSLI